MSEMTEVERIQFLQSAMKDAVKYNGDFMVMNEKYLSQYLGRPYGDEIEGQSQFVSTDIADVVEADMPSLARIFLGTNDILTFSANTDNPEEIKEAQDKTKYINYLVRHRPDSFPMIHGWLKDAEIQKFGAVKFYVEDKKTAEFKTYKGLSLDELTQLKETLKDKKGVESVKIASQDHDVDKDTYNIVFKVVQKCQKVMIQGVPTEDFLITRNAGSIKTARLVGDLSLTTRKALVAEGYDKEKVASLPAKTEDTEGNAMKQIRFEGQGGYDSLTDKQLNEEIQIANVYPLVDFDGDGIEERRNIIMSADGTVILQDEPYGLAPYAMLSAVLMPHSAIGRSRAEITAPTQYLKTHMVRGINNNIYQVNKPRFAVDDSQQSGVDLDDLLTQRLDGIVRCGGDPSTKIMPLVTPYIGDKALQVLQYVDFARAQSTGSLMASQGLSADDLHKETATRFEGVEDASEAKVELVARVYAETGFRELFDGLAWLVTHYQDEPTEIKVLGQPLRVDPSEWKYEHNCTSNVGLGAGDNEQVLNNTGTLLSVQEQLLGIGSPLVDQKKIFNVLSRMTKAMGMAQVTDYFNDPERPEQLLMAENEKLKATLAAMQQQMQDPTIAQAQIKAQAQIAVDTQRQQGDMQLEAAKIQGNFQLELERQRGVMQAQFDKQQADMNKFLLTLTQQNDQFRQNMLLELTKLDLETEPDKDNIPGTLETT
jgi:hypothetical protein